MKISISDNDLCATCKFCKYDPGKESSCLLNWPIGDEQMGDDIVYCPEYQKINKPKENWKLS